MDGVDDMDEVDADWGFGLSRADVGCYEVISAATVFITACGLGECMLVALRLCR
jgi:hypothetical protein